MTDAHRGRAHALPEPPDPRRLSPFLGSALPALRGPLRVEPLPGGQSNPTYLVRSARAAVVVRTKPAPVNELLPSAHAIERKCRAMTALRGAGFPVPEVHALCEDETVIGRAFYVMEHVTGRIFRDQTLPDLGRGERGPIYEEMNRVIAVLHAVDPAAIGLADFGGRGHYLERQIRRWTQQYRTSETGSIASMDELIAWLPTRVPAGDERRVVHGDFRMENLIFDPVRPRVLAVIDWELSTIGHPLADFAYHCLPWYMPPGEARGLAGCDLAALGIPDEAGYRARYARQSGRKEAQAWEVFVAFNFFRLAAILQGVYKRATQGFAPSERALRAGERARAMAALGWAHAQRA